MKKAIFLLCLCLITTGWSQLKAQNTEGNFKNPRIANYDIKAIFAPDEKMVHGNLLLHWRNTSKDTIKELQFHTYLNAFKNNKSSFLKSTASGPLSDIELPKFKTWNKMDQMAWLKSLGISKGEREDDWGWIEIKSMLLNNKNEVVERLTYIQPDDNNKNDETVIKVKLEQPLMPGQAIDVKIKFETKLPKIIGQSGYANDFYFVGQWYPKIGVWEPAGMRYTTKGRWNCHQYHANAGFYSDFGEYQVTITVPNEYTIGATGSQQSEVKKKDGLRELSYKAKDVSDFAWTACPKFKQVTDKHHQVSIIALMQAEHQKQAARYIKAAKAALDFFEAHIGTYPYPTLTIVDPPFSAMVDFSKGQQGISGSAFPGLITTGTLAHLPETVYVPEMVTVHELALSFLTAIGTNGVEESWLDEGLGAYLESRIMTATYGAKTSLLNFFGTRIGNFDAQRSRYVFSENLKLADLSRQSWHYSAADFAQNAKPTVWLTTLERLLGEAAMDEILQTYFSQWSYSHPSAENFIEIANSVYKKQKGAKLGENLNWFFEQMIEGTNVCDYKLANIKNSLEVTEKGFFEKKGKKIFMKGTEGSEGEDSLAAKYHSKVLVQRIGEVIVPVEVLVRFENGDTAIVNWNGRERSHEFTFDKEFKIVWAKIDPDQKLQIDINQTNNSMTLTPTRSAIWKVFFKFLFWIQNMIQFFAGVI